MVGGSACCTQTSSCLFWTQLCLTAPCLCIGRDNEPYLFSPCHLGCRILLCHTLSLCAVRGFLQFLHAAGTYGISVCFHFLIHPRTSVQALTWQFLTGKLLHTFHEFFCTTLDSCSYSGSFLNEGIGTARAAQCPYLTWLFAFPICFPTVLNICLAEGAGAGNVFLSVDIYRLLTFVTRAE